jgi:hypothetical protein
MNPLERILRADTRAHYRIADHHARELRDAGREDILTRYAAAVKSIEDGVGDRARLGDREVAAIEDEATDVIRQRERNRLASATPYPSQSRPV